MPLHGEPQMDVLNAPIYSPATAFELPVAAAFRGRLADFTVAELTKMPSAWALVLERFPALEAITSAPPIKALLHMGTLHGLNVLKPFATPEELAALDAELQRLPAFQVSAP
jgi:hypothetical protein